MKNLFLTFLFCFFTIGLNAAELPKTIDIDFRQVGIPELSNAVLGGMLKKNYLLSSDVLTDDRKITMSVKSINETLVLPLFIKLMASQNIQVTDSENVIFVQKTTAEPVNQFSPQIELPAHQTQDLQSITTSTKSLLYRHYQPLHRPVSYLAKIAKFTGSQVADFDDTSQRLIYSAENNDILDKTENLIKVSDSPRSAITIKAALIEYTDTTNSNRSLSGALTLLAGKLGIAYNAGQLLSNSMVFKSKTLNMAISAIDGDSSFKYLAEPTIRVLSGEKAKLVVGSEVPIRGPSTVAQNGNVIQSVDYRTAGVQFDVLPKINGETITLYINQQISNFGLTTTSNIDSPTLFKRQAETTLDIKRGSLIMMAGLDESKHTDTKSGISFLPDFLKSKSKNDNKSQILLLLEVVDEQI